MPVFQAIMLAIFISEINYHKHLPTEDVLCYNSGNMTVEITKNNDQFLSRLFKFALPLVLQYLIVNCLNLVDNIMIGSLGAVSISGVGLGNQVFFLTNLFMFGITGGATIFMAQYWGKKNTDSIHKTMGLSVILTLIIAAVFTTAGTVFAKQVISIYTPDPLVIAG